MGGFFGSPFYHHRSLNRNFDFHFEDLPPNLTHLTFGSNFNLPIHFLPDSLTHLTFGFSFDRPIYYFPPKLIYLELAALSQELTVFPFNLETLVCHSVGTYILQYLLNIKVLNTKHIWGNDDLPDSIIDLRCNGIPTYIARFPANLQILRMDFNFLLPPFPLTLKSLELYAPYLNKITVDLLLPKNLEKLKLHGISMSNWLSLPHNLTHLTLSNVVIDEWDAIMVLTNLTSLKLYSSHRMTAAPNFQLPSLSEYTLTGSNVSNLQYSQINGNFVPSEWESGLPDSLEDIKVAGQLQLLPSNLKKLYIHGISCCPKVLPEGLQELSIALLYPHTVPELPASLKHFHYTSCFQQSITSFPAGLVSLTLENTCQLVFPTTLHCLELIGSVGTCYLPPYLRRFTMSAGLSQCLTSLPPLPLTLEYLSICGHNSNFGNVFQRLECPL